MKKILFIALLGVFALCVQAQNSEQAKIIEEASAKYKLDADYGFSYVKVFEDLDKSKDKLLEIVKSFLPYIVSNDWRNNNLNMQVDEEKGTLVAKVSHDIVSNYSNMAHSFTTKAAPTVRFDCKDNRVRMIISEKEWDVTHLNKSGFFQKIERHDHKTTDCPPFKSTEKGYMDNMCYETFVNVYKLDMELFDKFDKFVRSNGVTTEGQGDDW